MNRFLIILIAIFACNSLSAQQNFRHARELIQAMHEQAQTWTFDEFTFVQTTERLVPGTDSLSTATWYEALRFPNLFRIDFGDPAGQTAILYRNDSSYLFRSGELVRQQPEINELLLLMGGIKTMSVDQVLAQMEKDGFNLDIFYPGSYKGQPIYVIGATADDEESKQVWIHREYLTTVRRIDVLPDGRRMDIEFSDFEQHGNKWIETKVVFNIDGKWFQTEYYEDIDVEVELKDDFFVPAAFGQWHWFEQK